MSSTEQGFGRVKEKAPAAVPELCLHQTHPVRLTGTKKER